MTPSIPERDRMLLVNLLRMLQISDENEDDDARVDVRAVIAALDCDHPAAIAAIDLPVILRAHALARAVNGLDRHGLPLTWWNALRDVVNGGCRIDTTTLIRLAARMRAVQSLQIADHCWAMAKTQERARSSLDMVLLHEVSTLDMLTAMDPDAARHITDAAWYIGAAVYEDVAPDEWRARNDIIGFRRVIRRMIIDSFVNKTPYPALPRAPISVAAGPSRETLPIHMLRHATRRWVELAIARSMVPPWLDGRDACQYFRDEQSASPDDLAEHMSRVAQTQNTPEWRRFLSNPSIPTLESLLKQSDIDRWESASIVLTCLPHAQRDAAIRAIANHYCSQRSSRRAIAWVMAAVWVWQTRQLDDILVALGERVVEARSYMRWLSRVGYRVRSRLLGYSEAILQPNADFNFSVLQHPTVAQALGDNLIVTGTLPAWAESALRAMDSACRRDMMTRIVQEADPHDIVEHLMIAGYLHDRPWIDWRPRDEVVLLALSQSVSEPMMQQAMKREITAWEPMIELSESGLRIAWREALRLMRCRLPIGRGWLPLLADSAPPADLRRDILDTLLSMMCNIAASLPNQFDCLRFLERIAAHPSWALTADERSALRSAVMNCPWLSDPQRHDIALAAVMDALDSGVRPYHPQWRHRSSHSAIRMAMRRRNAGDQRDRVPSPAMPEVSDPILQQSLQWCIAASRRRNG